jgi:UDP-N-acetylglucosamine--N-acetylmuramyl-(pentapeptide) pyrophosphoryl-undecaprenol N-acetylglucosamine transferase
VIMRDKTFLIMAGGTGGHVFPALAVASILMERHDKVVWLGSKGGMEEGVVSKASIPFFGIAVKGVRGKGRISQIFAPFKILSAIFQALSVLKKIKPDAVLGMGGFASGPGGLAARILGIPLVIHEQNAVAGMTNKILAKFATTIMTAFPNAFSEKVACKVVGNPLRSDIARLYFERDTNKKRETVHLLILGGSLGAQSLNEVVPKALGLLDESIRPIVWHQTGKDKSEGVNHLYSEFTIEVNVSEFIEDMAGAYKWADFVVCRAGAMTVSELCAAGLGAILIPYPHAVDDHQTKNAEYIVKGGAGWLLAQNTLTPKVLSEVMHPLLVKRERMNILSEAAYKLAQIDAAESVANECRRVSYASVS